MPRSANPGPLSHWERGQGVRSADLIHEEMNQMSSSLYFTDEHEMLRRSVRAFVEKELLPHEDEVERTDAVRPELRRQRCAAHRWHQVALW